MMATRRDFFKHFIGQSSKKPGEENLPQKIPLNRLHELPVQIIEQIKPVLFPQGGWMFGGDRIIVASQADENEEILELDQDQRQIFLHFRSNIRLKEIAEKMALEGRINFEEAFGKVTALFFRLASLRVCHPSEFYNIDQLKSKAEKQSDESL